MKETLSIIFGNAILFVSGGNIITKGTRKRLKEHQRKRRLSAKRMQAELDALHASGRGVRYCDGKTITFSPFTR